MNKPSSPSYSSFRSLLQSKLKGYWRVQSLERLKSRVDRGDLSALRLKKQIERNSSFDPPGFIQFHRCASSNKHSTQNQSLQCDISTNEDKSFFFTQTQKRVLQEEEQKNANLLLSIFNNNKRELNLYNSLPFVAVQEYRFKPRSFKDVLRDSQLIQDNQEHYRKAILFFKQLNNNALKHSFQKEFSSESKIMLKEESSKDTPKEDCNGLERALSNKEAHSYPNTVILFKKIRKVINKEQSKRSEAVSGRFIKAKKLKDIPVLNQSSSLSTRKTILSNRRNDNALFHDNCDKKTSYRSNSRDIKPSKSPFMQKDFFINTLERKTILIKRKRKGNEV